MRNKRRFDSKLKLCTKGRIFLSPLDFLTSSTFLRFLLSYYIFSYLLTSLSYAIYSNMEVWMCLTSTQIFLNFWTFKCQRMNYETRLTNMTITQMKGFCDFLLRIYMNVGNASYSLTYSHSLKITQNVSFEYWHFQHFLSY